jgi:hypothetical protein
MLYYVKRIVVEVKIYVIKKKSWRKIKVNGRPRVGKKGESGMLMYMCRNFKKLM